MKGRSAMLLAAINSMSEFYKDLYGTRQTSLLDIPPKPETDKWYFERAEARRKRRSEKKGMNR